MELQKREIRKSERWSPRRKLGGKKIKVEAEIGKGEL